VARRGRFELITSARQPVLPRSNLIPMFQQFAIFSENKDAKQRCLRLCVKLRGDCVIEIRDRGNIVPPARAILS